MPRLRCRIPLPLPMELGRIGAILNAGLMPFSRRIRADSFDFFSIGVKSIDSSSSNMRHSSAPTFGSISWPSRPIFTGLPSFHGLNKWPVAVNESSFLHTQSTSMTPPSALADIPGGNTHDTAGTSRLDSPTMRANPANFPLSFTENIKITLRFSLNAWFSVASFCGSVDQTLFDFDKFTLSALFDLITKNLVSLNK